MHSEDQIDEVLYDVNESDPRKQINQGQMFEISSLRGEINISSSEEPFLLRIDNQRDELILMLNPQVSRSS